MSVEDIKKKINVGDVEKMEQAHKDKKSNKVKQPRLSHSVYHFTFNTNKIYKDNEEENNKTFENLKNAVAKVTYGLIQGNFIEFKKEPKKVERVDYALGAIEFSETFKQIHIHCLYDISHRTRIKLNFKEMKETFNKELGSSGYMHFKLIRQSQSMIQEYINKNIKQVKEQTKNWKKRKNNKEDSQNKEEVKESPHQRDDTQEKKDEVKVEELREKINTQNKIVNPVKKKINPVKKKLEEYIIKSSSSEEEEPVKVKSKKKSKAKPKKIASDTSEEESEEYVKKKKSKKKKPKKKYIDPLLDFSD